MVTILALLIHSQHLLQENIIISGHGFAGQCSFAGNLPVAMSLCLAALAPGTLNPFEHDA
jgi:hypothetical protein